MLRRPAPNRILLIEREHNGVEVKVYKPPNGLDGLEADENL